MSTYNDVNWHGGGKGSASSPAAAKVSADGDKWGAGTICPVCLQKKDWLGRCDCNCNAPDLVNVQQDGFDLDLLPWEDAQDVIDQANAVLDEMDCKPGLGIDDEFDELEFMGAELDTLRLGLVEPIVRLTSAQMDEIEDERIGADVCQRPYLW